MIKDLYQKLQIFFLKMQETRFGQKIIKNSK